MPRFLPFSLSLVIALACFGVTCHRIKQVSAEPEAEFVGPGTFTFTAPAADHYTLWHKATATIDGVYTVRDKGLPAGTEISVTRDGEIIPTKAHGGAYVSGTDAGDKNSVLTFKASAPGAYVIKVSGIPDRHAFSVTRGYALSEIMWGITWAMATFFAGGVSLVLLVLVLSKVWPKPALPPKLA